MQKTLVALKEQHNLKPASINFLGVSLGALEGAFLSVIDAEEKKIGIDRYLLINPPVDLAYAVRKIDEWDALGEKLGKEKAQQTVAKGLEIIESFANERSDRPAVFDRLVKKFAGFTREELEFLIGENLQNQLPELIYVSQVINDQKVLSAPSSEMRMRLEEAGKFSFSDYNTKIGLPLWQKQAGEPQATLESFIQKSSLAQIVDRLRGNAKVHILHNADDFLAERKSIIALKESLGAQVTLYPYGGHLGNLWFPENKKRILGFFQQRRMSAVLAR
jgi:hypothetical protein